MRDREGTMADQRNGGIAWCDATWNPVIGCRRVSAGCEHCWAVRMAHRLSAPSSRGPREYAGITRATAHGPDWSGDARLVLTALPVPLFRRRPRRIAVSLMGDLWRAAPEAVGAVFGVMAAAKHHTYLSLTKRSELGVGWLYDVEILANPGHAWEWCRAQMLHHVTPPHDDYGPQTPTPWPLPHVWLGFSAEDQASFDERWAHAREWGRLGWHTWVSLEPLLGPVTLPVPGPEWVVAGGESGPGARPMRLAWVRSLRDQCAERGTPVFFKQWGEWAPAVRLPWRLEPVEGGPCFVPRSEGPGTWSFDGETDEWAVRIGRRAAGALLDGRQWHEIPEVKA